MQYATSGLSALKGLQQGVEQLKVAQPNLMTYYNQGKIAVIDFQPNEGTGFSCHTGGELIIANHFG